MAAAQRLACTRGAGVVVIGTTPAWYDALQVPFVKRSHAGAVVRQLLAHVAEEDKVVTNNLAAPGESTKRSWFALNHVGLGALAAAACGSTPAELNGAIRRGEIGTSVSRAVQRELAEQGLHCCTTCTMPVLDVDCEQYEQKVEFIQAVGRRDAQLAPCACGHATVIR